MDVLNAPGLDTDRWLNGEFCVTCILPQLFFFKLPPTQVCRAFNMKMN